MTDCPGFAPSLWQPRKCIHCFKFHGLPTSVGTRSAPALLQLATKSEQPKRLGSNLREKPELKRTNSNKNLPQAHGDKHCDNFSAQRWRPTICLNCFCTLADHKQPPTSKARPDQKHFITDCIKPSPAPPTPSLPLSGVSNLAQTVVVSEFKNEEVSMHESDDEDDPFRDFEDFDDALPSTTTTTTTTTHVQINATLNSESRTMELLSTQFNSTSFGASSRSSIKVEHFVKYTESEDEWNDGVDITSILSNGDYSYVNNKISEIASVKEEMKRSQARFEDNPTLLLALVDILKAKQQQIQLAFERDKIDKQDHSKLLDSLKEVRTMLMDNDRTSLC